MQIETKFDLNFSLAIVTLNNKIDLAYFREMERLVPSGI